MNTTGIWPYLGAKLEALVIQAKQDSLDVDLFSGFRSIEEQDKLYALGRTVKNPDGVRPDRPLGQTVTKAKGGDSWHNWGLAGDVVFKVKGQWSWDPKLPWSRLGEFGRDLGLEWGGDWKFKDEPHFQLVGGLTIAEAKAIGDVVKVWAEVAKRVNGGLRDGGGY